MFRIVARPENLSMDVHMNVFQMVPQDLVFCPMIWTSRKNVVHATKQLDILTLAISVNLERPPFSLGCKVKMRRSLRQRDQAIWK